MLFLMFIAFQKNGGVIRLTGTGGCHFVLFVPKTRKLSLFIQWWIIPDFFGKLKGSRKLNHPNTFCCSYL